MQGWYRQFLYTYPPVFQLLTFSTTMVHVMKTKKPLALLHCCKLNSRLYLHFTGFPPSFPFVGRDPIQDPASCLVFPWSLLGCDSVSIFPCFRNVTGLRSTTQLFCRMPLSLGLSDVLMRNTAEGQCRSHRVPTGVPSINMISSQLMFIGSPGKGPAHQVSSPSGCLSLPFPYSFLWKG